VLPGLSRDALAGADRLSLLRAEAGDYANEIDSVRNFPCLDPGDGSAGG